MSLRGRGAARRIRSARRGDAANLCLAPADGLSFVTEGTRLVRRHRPGSAFLEIPGTTEVCLEDPRTMAEALIGFLAP